LICRRASLELQVSIMGECVIAFFSRTRRGSNGIFGVVDGSFEPTGLLLSRAHMVLISLCAREESVPRSE
jgi:hypothetical protein